MAALEEGRARAEAEALQTTTSAHAAQVQGYLAHKKQRPPRILQ